MAQFFPRKARTVVAAVFLGGTCASGAHAQGWEHFTCYDIDPHGGFDERSVKLEDQFAQYEGLVIRPVSLCNPVDKNGEGIQDRDYHLVCYEIKADPVSLVDRTIDVNTANQFTEQSMTAILPPRTLCVPSKKALL